MHCSAVMEAELFQLLKYCRLSGIDYEDIIRDGYAAGSLPCKDKKEGKRCLEQLRKEIVITDGFRIFMWKKRFGIIREHKKFCPAFRRHR